MGRRYFFLNFNTWKRFFLVIAFILPYSDIMAQNLPLGYISHFESDFSAKTLHKNLIFTPSADYKIENGYLQLKAKPDTAPVFWPAAAMIINRHVFGDFISELSLINNTTGSDNCPGLFFIFGLRNPQNYYAVQFKPSGAVFLKMYKGAVDTIDQKPGFVPATKKTVNLRIERNILEQSVTFKMNGKEITFTDPNLVMGYFGLGTETSHISVDKLSIWAPTSLNDSISFFH
ncbi:MAG: hypothetical protein JXB34_01705 [Bacteroidales bacterium]|nr:hypothetical protein [Bacteroidales bacterium]